MAGGLASTSIPLRPGKAHVADLHRATDLAARLQAIEARITEEVRSERIVGMAIAIARDGSSLWEKGFGWANLESQQRAGPHTPFSLASLTKLLTTAATMALVDRGAIDIDDPVERHLSITWPRGFFDASGVTLRQLGGHAAGLPSFFQLADVPGEPPSLAKLMGYARLAYPAGERFEYSNIGYGLLGEAIASAARQPYEDFVNQALIRPMGLRDTFFAASPSAQRRMATRYDDDRKAYPFYTTATPASGELVGSVSDLNRFAAHIMATARHSVLSKAALAEMLSPVVGTENDSFFAFGWAGRRIGGETVFVKAGGDPGVATRLIAIPKCGISIAICANSGCDALVESIGNSIATLYFPEWVSPSEASKDGSTLVADNALYTGEWAGQLVGSGMSTPIKISLSGMQSRVKVGDKPWSLLTEIKSEGLILTARSQGPIGLEQRGAGASTLWFKFVERAGVLTGRCLSRSPFLTLPYILRLSRG